MNIESEFFNRFELLISSIGVILGFLFSIQLLLVKKDKGLKANLFLSLYFLVLSLRATKAIFHNYYEMTDSFLAFFLCLFLLIGPYTWFYVKHRYYNNTSIKKIEYYLHFTPFCLITIYSVFVPNNNFTYTSIFYLGLFLHGLIYCFYSLYWLINTQSDTIVLERQETIKKWLLFFILSTILVFINAILIFFDIVPFYPSSTFLFSFINIFMAVLGYKNLWLFEMQKEKYSNSTLNTKIAREYSHQLNQFMEKDKLYLDPELTLVKLAEKMNISSKQLSQIINQIEHTNYSQYIARYRVEEAKKYLENPDYNNYKISAIAYESGFNSISSFNTTFKNITKTTAIDYRELFMKK
ncbi:helix-turn-helix domain-containing protein [Flavobacterium undicola]|uniref:helix-turn-helix domain-containing protein n=1 Tax=Flavobacterium undicola TaxID=1932779 RepID=UPI00137733AD|nr:AraC family transcriptional regulator [Flavobacterium undicola]MBA0882823.1 AraC family transcriptional regulator [Flavobacterium undicola]